MRTKFPEFNAIAVGTSADKSFQVVGLGASPDDTLYLAAWQSAASGNWMIPSYNPLPHPPSGPVRFTSVAMGEGTDGNLQVIALGKDGHIYLAGAQRPDGSWWRPYTDVLGGRRIFTSITLGKHPDRHQQIIALGTDGWIYLAGEQKKDGHWYSHEDSAIDKRRAYQAIVAASGIQRHLQLIGLGNDGKIYLAAWQDTSSQSGGWHLHSGPPIGGDRTYKAVAVDERPNGEAQVFGLGIDDRIYLAARMNTNKVWQTLGTQPLDDSRTYKAVAVARRNSNHLEVIGLGSDDKIHLVAWQYGDGTNDSWHPHKGPPIGGDQTYKAMALLSRGDGWLRVFGVGTDGVIYLASWITPQAEWHMWGPLSQEADTGRWNSRRLADIPAAFNAVPNVASKSGSNDYVIRDEDGSIRDHYQGMADWKDYYILTHDLDDDDHGFLRVLNRKKKKDVARYDTPEKGYNHPGGCQVVGDYLGVEMEKKENGKRSIIRFYWMGSMTDSNPPTLLPSRFVTPAGSDASAIAITDIGTGGERTYLMALNIDGTAVFYRTNGCLLDDPDLTFEEIFRGSLRQTANGVTGHGADNLSLLTDQAGHVYMIAFAGEEIGGAFGVPRKIDDYAELYKVDLDKKKLVFLESRHMDTNEIDVTGPHFRFGAGCRVTASGRLKFYCSARSRDGRVFPPTDSGPLEITTFGN